MVSDSNVRVACRGEAREHLGLNRWRENWLSNNHTGTSPGVVFMYQPSKEVFCHGSGRLATHLGELVVIHGD